MLTQQCIELNRIEEEMATTPYQGIPVHVIALLPPAQQQMLDANQALRTAAPPGPIAGQPVVAVQHPATNGQPFLQGVGQPAVATPVLVADGREIRGGQPTRQVAVQVPPGTVPGQMITFTAPDGTQCTAAVPAGMAPGQTFTHYY